MLNAKNIIILISGIILGTIIAVGAFNFGRKPPQVKTIVSPTPISTLAPEKDVLDKGVVEGSMSFPSEGIPDQVLVCAENIQTRKEFCTDKRINDPKYTYRVGFKLEVPTGKYLVYEKMPPDEYRAYYSEFVTCGLSVNCTSHEPIVVEVKKNQTVSEVDPQDWYNRPTPT